MSSIPKNKVVTEKGYSFFRGTAIELAALLEKENLTFVGNDPNGYGGDFKEYKADQVKDKSLSPFGGHLNYAQVFVKLPVKKLYGDFLYAPHGKKFVWTEMDNLEYGVICEGVGLDRVYDAQYSLESRYRKAAEKARKKKLQKEAADLGLTVKALQNKRALEKLEASSVKYSAERVEMLIKVSKIRTDLDSIAASFEKNTISDSTNEALNRIYFAASGLTCEVMRHANRNTRLNKLRSAK